MKSANSYTVKDAAFIEELIETLMGADFTRQEAEAEVMALADWAKASTATEGSV